MCTCHLVGVLAVVTELKVEVENGLNIKKRQHLARDVAQ